jgi:cobalt-zinc-cadmium efflux system outer membrane protein
MRRRRGGESLLPGAARVLALMLAAAACSAPVHAQEEELLPSIVGGASGGAAAGMTSLGRSPGAGGPLIDNAPGAGEPLLGGRPGAAFPRVPTTITTPGGGYAAPPARAIGTPPSLPISSFPLYGPLEVPSGPEEEGPRDALTLDQAIERLLAANLDLRARFHELPKAQADILTAGLRANPLLFFDAQQVPYGNFSNRTQGGPTQYDLNINHPIDLSHKRQARQDVACRAKRVLEAQFQDAVRIEIDNLYTAWVDVLAARETIRYARASVAGLAEVLRKTRAQLQQQIVTEADVDRVKNQLTAAEIGLADAEDALRDANRTLGGLLAIPARAAENLAVRGTIHDTAPPPPPLDVILPSALTTRPDLVAYRLGIARAEADVRLARAQRFSDVYLLYQPYTAYNGAPFDRGTVSSWALGATVPLPVYNRNQGNIERAKINVDQVKTELASHEGLVEREVYKAVHEYAITRAAVSRVERELLPSARRVRDTTLRQFELGEIDAIAYLTAERDYNDVVRQYRETVIRHRRSMLRLNTVVGQRILP